MNITVLEMNITVRLLGPIITWTIGYVGA